ncbi:hypothetical protein H2200_005212 [Cladophialophora chaetospira]|uniref:VOC domain-containing protein n=1 Tax=Cladophialophora chaetospira TaxID=386627 RepID=A0AA38XBJ0_9EURO|nr:hypothetical protein H2200_005212 [Cladophialophora chaetospira]
MATITQTETTGSKVLCHDKYENGQSADDLQSREISPNRGFMLADSVETDDIHMSQADFRDKYNIDKAKQIKLSKLAFMRYQHPDLQQIKTFLKDFGLFKVKETADEIWFRGYGADQYVYYARRGPKQFLGGAFEVESYGELERALSIPETKVLSNGIEELKDAPGGGHIVTLSDPEDFPISLVYGQTPGQAQEMPRDLLFNNETHKPRVREWSRFKPGPAAVHKLGHYGLVVRDFQSQLNFYTKNFNLMPTNILYVDDGNEKTDVGMFAHVDRGTEVVDHHTLFLVSLPPGHEIPHVHHCSFEIHDFDTQAMGHEWLTRKGYKPAWGVGRHILGSQIFDYWWDPNDFMVEHYIDGDVVNGETPVSFHAAASAKDAAWSPDVPSSFLE